MRWLVLLALSLLAACARPPRMAELIAQRQYREALFATRGARGADDYRTRDLLVQALARDLRPAVHLSPVGEAELRPLIGEAAEPLLHKAVLLRLTYEATPVPVDSLELHLELVGHGVVVTGQEPSRELLATLTGEPIPGRPAGQPRSAAPALRTGWRQARRGHHRARRGLSLWPRHWTIDTLRAMHGTVSGARRLGSLAVGMVVEPLKMLTDPVRAIWGLVAALGSGGSGRPSAPTAKDWARSAPLATALGRVLIGSQAWPPRTCRRAPRRWHRSHYLLFPRTKAPPSHVAVTLMVEARTDDLQQEIGYSHNLQRGAASLWTERALLSLGQGATAEARIQQTFGRKMVLIPSKRFRARRYR